MIELTDEEQQAFQERAQQVRETYVEMVGEEGQAVLTALQSEIDAAEKELGAN
jgi:hypothetical protein